MGIFRGVGGTGESSSDSTINATTALLLQAQQAAAAALASETAAELAETNAETAETNAASSASAASTSASNASTSATNAASSASSASSSASTATTQATNAASSASAAATSETNAASSASSASSSASTATTQAGIATTKASEASTSATNAASSASAASTSATNAASSASTASTAASTATTKASEASTSATNASNSATNAASSAAAAASALDSFDDRYLGTKASDPTLDNDGNALATGALYFSTTSNVMKVYDGASWITATSAGATSLLRFRYVATSGQTTFSGADSAAATLTYTVNNIAVHRNGVTLDTSEYTASNGTSIVLNVAAGTGDIVDIIAFKSFTVADALSAVSGGTVNGSVGITGNLGFTGTGNRITGDFSNATIANRVMFQTSTTNSATDVGIAPNGSGASSTIAVYSSSDMNNSSRGSFNSVSGTDIRIASAITGTGTYLPMTFYTGGSERVRIDTSGNVGIGLTNPSAKLTVNSGATVNNFFTSTTGTNTYTPTASTSLANANWQIQAGNASGACTGIRLSQSSNFELFLGGVQEAGGAAAFVFQGYNGSSYAERMRITSAGNVAIGVATPQGKLHVVDQVDRTSTTGQFTITGNGYQAAHWLDATAYYIGQNSNSREVRIYSGSSVSVGVRLTAGNNAWQTYSDERMKDIIEPIENAAQKVSTLRTVIGKYKTDEADTRRVFMIAQDVQAVLPEAVTTDAEGMLGMAYDHIVPLLTAAIKEQQAIITSLTDRITALENK